MLILMCLLFLLLHTYLTLIPLNVTHDFSAFILRGAWPDLLESGTGRLVIKLL